MFNKNVDILNYLPQIMQQLEQFKQIANAENPEINTLWTAIEDLLNNQFVVSANEDGIAKYEALLDIQPKATDELEVRRFRVLGRITESIPYTYNALKAQLNNLCGNDGYTIKLNNGTYTLIVKVALTSKKQYDEVDALLKRTVPANIIIDLDLLYNSYNVLNTFTYEQLETFTYEDLRSTALS